MIIAVQDKERWKPHAEAVHFNIKLKDTNNFSLIPVKAIMHNKLGPYFNVIKLIYDDDHKLFSGMVDQQNDF